MLRKCLGPAILFVCAIYILAPLYFMLMVSLGTPQDILTEHPPLAITNFTLAHWTHVLGSGYLWAPFFKSASVATFAMLGSLILAVPAAYAISRLPRAIAYGLILLLLASRMIPEISVALSVAVAFLKLNLLDTHLGLVLAHMIRTLPLVAWIMVGTFRSVPRELEEAGSVDGANRWQVLRRIVLPLAAPGLAVAAIFAWLESWNEFIYALYLTMLKPTLPLKILYYVQRGSWFHSATYTMILVIPVLLVILILQRRIRTEYFTVGIKG